MNWRPPRSNATRIRQLAEIQARFTPEDRERKVALLGALEESEIEAPRLLLQYHETLLFIRAYPDDATVLELAAGACEAFADRVEALQATDPDAAEELEDSGLVGTRVHYSYDYATARHLVRAYGDALRIDWDEESPPHAENLDLALILFAHWMENDALDLGEVWGREWIEMAKGDASVSDLRWLIESLERIRAPFALKTYVYESLGIYVTWDLGRLPVSRTHGFIPWSDPTFHSGPLRRKVKDFGAVVARPYARKVRPAPRPVANRLLRTIRATLGVRHRSLHPIDFASPRDVLVFEPGRGYQFVLFGMEPGDRLPLESDYGALLMKNGFVIGYAVGAMLFGVAEMAVNIFDTWRGGESGFIFSEYARIFCQHFGCTRLRIERYQVGYENEEGLESGSFWFYYKMGFIPQDPAVRRLAAREMARIRKNRAYRTSIATLERLCVSDLYFDLSGDASRVNDGVFPVGALSLNTSRWIAATYGGDGRKAEREAAATVSKALGCPDYKRWPRWERTWFERLSVTMAQIPDLARWPKADRTALHRLMRAKGKTGEVEFVRRMAEHGRLRRALDALAED